MAADREGVLKLQLYTRRMSEVAKRRLEELRGRLGQEEQALIATWRRTSLAWAGLGGLFGFVCARLPPWPLSTLPSSILGTMSAAAVGAIAAARQAPAVVAGLVAVDGDSNLVDGALCPALLELEGCIEDAKCHAALKAAAASFRDAHSILELVAKCRARNDRAAPRREADGWAFEPPPRSTAEEDFD